MDIQDIFSWIGIIITIIGVVYAIKVTFDTRKFELEIRNKQLSVYWYEKRIEYYRKMMELLNIAFKNEAKYETIVKDLKKNMSVFETEAKFLFTEDIMNSFFSAFLAISIYKSDEMMLNDTMKFNEEKGYNFNYEKKTKETKETVSNKINIFDKKISDYIKNNSGSSD